MNTQEVIEIAAHYIDDLRGHEFDVIDVSKPATVRSALFLSTVISKLSPLVGNLIEFNIAEFLNAKKEFEGWGEWLRQDPGFPDTIFHGIVQPTPGIEIKAWFPLATEITARFKDSQNHFTQNNTYVAMLAWLPEHLIYGKPRIIDVSIMSAMSVAQARDDHYHNPPDYLVMEPEDTSARTANLQQTNTNGYKFQGTPEDFVIAQQIVREWGENGNIYAPTAEYQNLLRTLTGNFKYRLETNYAKMDRIEHKEIETFKTRVLNTQIHGMSVAQWSRLMSSGNAQRIAAAFEKYINIREDVEDLIE